MMSEERGKKKYTRSYNKKIINGVEYYEKGGFDAGVLPIQKEVMQNMMYLLRPDRAGKIGRTVDEASRFLSHALIRHWEYCNVYTIKIQHVQKKILKGYNIFKTNSRTKTDRQTDSWKKKMVEYNHDMEKLFDIFCTDLNARKKREEELGVQMTEDDMAFYNDMKTSRKMYCEDFVDKRWQAETDRKLAKEKRYKNLQEKKKADEEELKVISWDDVTLEEEDEPCPSSSAIMEEVEDQSQDSVSNADFFTPPSTKEGTQLRMKRKRLSTPSSNEDDMPYNYRHIRTNVNVVKPQYYETVDRIKSELHCSANQATGAVIRTGNGLFGRKWKTHNEDKSVIDLDTAPHVKHSRETGYAITALCLSEIVTQIMESDSGGVVYLDDGSKKQGIGGYSVQGITIDKVYRPLTTLPVASECRTNLAALKMAVLSILATCNGNYSPVEIYNAVSFKVTDSTSHNFEVDEIVALELGTDHIPPHLLCHTHPALMFNRKIVEVCSKIEKVIGPDKIYSAFLVNATNSHDSVLEQYIDCVVRLISEDFNHKSWNCSKDFNLFLQGEKNKAKALKKERFNRFTYMAAVVLHHQRQVQDFLKLYNTVTNTLACIVRAFEECEFLSVLLMTTALIGIHLIEPYLSVTYFDPVDYEHLIPIMCQLYDDLMTTDATCFLDISKPALSFVDLKRFKDSSKLWDSNVLNSIKEYLEVYEEKVINVLKILVPELAHGFFVQRGDVFGFGDCDPLSPKRVSQYDLEQLNKVPINNLDSERAVGSINYELNIRGATQLNAASSNFIKNKSYDLIELKPIGSYKDFKEKAKKVNSLVREWQEKQKEMEKEGMNKKMIESLASEKRKMKDLEKLKNENGPFTKPEEVDEFMKRDISDAEKQKRLYTEVRYARDTTLSMPKNSDIFRLKEKYKSLPAERFAVNLKVYLGKAKTNASASWEDFDSAVAFLRQ